MSGTPQSEPPDRSRTGTASRTAAIARIQFRQAVRSRTLQALFVSLLAATALVFQTAGAGGGASNETVVGLLGLPFQLLVPVAAILAGGFAVSGDRESGTLRLLLGLPSSRPEVVVGKFLGAGAAIGSGVAASVGFAALVSLVIVGRANAAGLLGLGAATILLGAAFLGFATGVSAAVSTQKRSTAAATAGYLTLLFLWEPVVAGAHYAATRTLPAPPLSPWVRALELSNPIEAYAVAAEAFGVPTVAPLRVTFGLVTRSPSGSTGSADPLSNLAAPVAIAALGLWIAIPVAVGTLRFRRADIR